MLGRLAVGLSGVRDNNLEPRIQYLHPSISFFTTEEDPIEARGTRLRSSVLPAQPRQILLRPTPVQRGWAQDKRVGTLLVVQRGRGGRRYAGQPALAFPEAGIQLPFIASG